MATRPKRTTTSRASGSGRRPEVDASPYQPKEAGQQLNCTVSIPQYEKMRRVSERLDMPMRFVMEALLRSFDEDRLVLRVAKQRDKDAEARARAACDSPDGP